MKTKHLLLTFTVILGSILFKDLPAQQYHPFPEENAFWTVVEFSQNFRSLDTYIYTFNGDTTINILIYKKVYQLNDTNAGQDTIWKLHVFMRQEVDNKKVFFIRHYLGETVEKLGYDFNPDIGDTISLPAFAYEEYDTLFRRFVTDDSIQLWNGEYRKTYGFVSIVESGYALFVIEGIGEQRTAFPNLHYWDPHHQSIVTCFILNGEYLYGWSPEPDECDFTVQISEKIQKDKLLCKPNPANNYLTFLLPDYGSDTYALFLINIMGETIIQQHICTHNSQYVLDVSNLSAGIYYVILKSAKLYYTNKIVINH